MIRVHVTPRKALFDPSLWKTNQASLRYALLSKLRGGRVSELIPALSEGVEVRSLEDSLHEQKPCPNVGLWIGRSRFEKHNNFKPAVGPSIESCELPVDACSRCPLSMEDEEGRLEHGVPAHASWTVPELRTLLMEARSAQEHPSKKEADVMKGLTKCSLPELIKMATDQGITLPAKPTRGWLLLSLRPSKSTLAETIVPFGKFKGWLYREIPLGYLDWAIKECKANPNHHHPDPEAGYVGRDGAQASGDQGSAFKEFGAGPRSTCQDPSTRLEGTSRSKLGFLLEPGRRLYHKAELGIFSASSGRCDGGGYSRFRCRGRRDHDAEDSSGSARGEEGVEGRRCDHHRGERMLPVTSLPTPVELVRGLRDPERMGATLMSLNLRLSMSSVVRRPIPRLMTSWILGRRPLLAFAVGRD